MQLFIKSRKTDISLIITQYYFPASKNIRLTSIQHFITKIPNKRELQQIAINNSSDIDCKDFMNLCKICTARPYSFLVNYTTLSSDNPVRFRWNLLERI